MTKSSLIACTLALFTVTVGCSSTLATSRPQGTEEIHFLRYKEERGGAGDAALLTGVLELSEQCLVVVEGNFGTIFTPVWPYEYSYKQDVNSVALVDDSGKVVARTGERISIGGSEFSPIDYAEVEEYVSGNLNCPKPFWDVVDVQ